MMRQVEQVSSRGDCLKFVDFWLRALWNVFEHVWVVLRKRLRRVRRILAVVSQPFLEGEAASEKFAQLRVSNLNNVLRLLGVIGTQGVQIMSYPPCSSVFILFIFSKGRCRPEAHDLVKLHDLLSKNQWYCGNDSVGMVHLGAACTLLSQSL